MRLPLDRQSLEIRSDSQGDGRFGARRSSSDGKARAHRGVDLLCRAGETIFSPVDGIVTSLNFCYANDATYKLVEITGEVWVHRMLYLEPSTRVNAQVQQGDPVGRALSIAAKYGRDMQDHIHWECRIRNELLLVGRGRRTSVDVWVNPAKMVYT